MRHVMLVPAVVVAMLGLSCTGADHDADRSGVSGPTAATGEGAGRVGVSNVPPVLVWSTQPAADMGTQPPTVSGQAPLRVTFNLCRSSDPDASDSLNWQFHFGDSGRDAVNPDGTFNADFARHCRAEHEYAPGVYVATLSVTDKRVDDQSADVVAFARSVQQIRIVATRRPGAQEFESSPAAGATITLSATLGSTSTATVDVTNAGEDGLTVAPSGLSGELSVSPGTQQVVAGGANQAFTISCSPAALTTTTQTLTLTSNDADEGTNTYTVECTGTPPWPPAGCYYSSVYSLYIVWAGNQTQTPIDLTYDGTCATPPHTGVGGFMMVSEANASAAATFCTSNGYTFIDEISSSADTGAWPIYRCQI